MQSTTSLTVPGDFVYGLGVGEVFIAYHASSVGAFVGNVLGTSVGVGMAFKQRHSAIVAARLAHMTRWGAPEVPPLRAVAVSKGAATQYQPKRAFNRKNKGRIGKIAFTTSSANAAGQQGYTAVMALNTIGRCGLRGSVVGALLGAAGVCAYTSGIMSPALPWDAAGVQDRVQRINSNELVRSLDLYSCLGLTAGAGAGVIAGRLPIVALGVVGMNLGTLAGVARFTTYSRGYYKILLKDDTADRPE